MMSAGRATIGALTTGLVLAVAAVTAPSAGAGQDEPTTPAAPPVNCAQSRNLNIGENLRKA